MSDTGHDRINSADRRKGQALTGCTLYPIGTLQTPWHSIGDCPRNGRQLDPAPACLARVFPDFLEGLQSLRGFSHLILLYWMDQARGPELVFTPPFDAQPRGLFATRGPRRPNPIGLSVVAFDGLTVSHPVPWLVVGVAEKVTFPLGPVTFRI